MKRFLAVLLTFVVMLSLMGTTAFAEVARASRVNIIAPKSTVAVGKTIYLDINAYPNGVDWDRVVWYTDDYDLIDLDRDYGDVTGLEPGTATVKVEIYMTETDEDSKNFGKSVRVGTGSRTIKVTGTSPSGGTGILPREVDDDGNVIKTSGTNGAITSATVTDAVKKALVKGAATSTTFKNYDSVSAYALQSAATAMKGGTVTLHFDTINGTSIEGRLSINPDNASDLRNDINVGVYTNNVQTYKAKGAFQKYFKNNVAIVKTAQSGSYGMSVKIAAKVDDNAILKSKDLRLYTYDLTTNKYSEIKDAGLRVDANGFVHFTTSEGGYLIVSNGALVKK